MDLTGTKKLQKTMHVWLWRRIRDVTKTLNETVSQAIYESFDYFITFLYDYHLLSFGYHRICKYSFVFSASDKEVGSLG